MFFTFWGLSVLKDADGTGGPKNIKERMFGMMTPSGTKSLGTSKLNFFGMGSSMLRSMMKDQGVASLEELVAIAKDLDVKMIACTMSMDVMGISKEELVKGVEYGGVATFMADAARARVSLFV
jgi:peroxiredoxin family protein